MKTALITGINGMDGSHLAELLLEKGYKVYGLERRSSSRHRKNLKNIESKICTRRSNRSKFFIKSIRGIKTR